MTISNLVEAGPKPIFPQLLADISLDLFALVQYWRAPLGLSGPERGRLFEGIFVNYCQLRGLRLVEKAGSVTLNGQRTASGFRHESDAVIRTADVLLQVELKFLGHRLGKNELLIFNQKGFDFLSAQSGALRQKPLYRIVVSAGALSPAARSFALHWGIVVIEPDWLPLPALHAIAIRDEFGGTEAQEIVREVPQLVLPLQARASRFAAVLPSETAVILPGRVERVLTALQKRCGDRYRHNIERVQCGLLTERYCQLRPALERLERAR